ncbi:toprim domain-containing protein, partial [Vibrio breoganii]
YLHITEGIETALSVMQAKQEPVWPCVSSTLLAKFNPPKEIKHIFIWADKDRKKNGKCAGLDAAKELLERMAVIGVECTIMYPQDELANRNSVDWNDILVNHGENGFPPHHLYLWQGAVA